MKNKIAYFIFFVLVLLFAAMLSIRIADNIKPTNINSINPLLLIDNKLKAKRDSINQERKQLDKKLKELLKLDSINKLTGKQNIVIIKKEYEKINNFNDTTRRFWFDSVFSANNVFK